MARMGVGRQIDLETLGVLPLGTGETSANVGLSPQQTYPRNIAASFQPGNLRRYSSRRAAAA